MTEYTKKTLRHWLETLPEEELDRQALGVSVIIVWDDEDEKATRLPSSMLSTATMRDEGLAFLLETNLTMVKVKIENKAIANSQAMH